MIEEIRIPFDVPQHLFLGRWLVPDGAAVEQGQAICDSEGETATVDLPSPVRGTLQQLVAEGTPLRAGLVIGTLRHGGT